MVEMEGLCEEYIRKVGVVGRWRELAEDRGKWSSSVVKAGQKLGAIGHHP